VAQNKDHWRDLVNAVMNIKIPQKAMDWLIGSCKVKQDLEKLTVAKLVKIFFAFFMEKMRHVYKILVRKPEGKGQLGKLRR
jgi:hypothetical protein